MHYFDESSNNSEDIYNFLLHLKYASVWQTLNKVRFQTQTPPLSFPNLLRNISISRTNGRCKLSTSFISRSTLWSGPRSQVFTNAFTHPIYEVRPEPEGRAELCTIPTLTSTIFTHTVRVLLHFLIPYFTLLSKSLLLAKFKLTRQSRKWSPGSITKNHTCTNWAQKNDLRYVLRNKALFQPCVLFATRMSLKEASPYSMWTAAL